MKLLNKTSIYYLVFALPVFVVCSGLLYYFISKQIIDGLDESLSKKKTVIEHKLKSGISPDFLKDDEITFKLLGENTGDFNYHISDTLLYDSMEAEMIPFRTYRTIVNDGNNNYELSINKSYIETDDLIASILYPVIFLFIALLAGFFLINWFISRKLWLPFYKTLKQLDHYKIDETQIEFDSSAIKEFSELNLVLTSMTEKIHNDFICQKQFIENASHEIQTPLAVIKNKIELLIQSKKISEADMQIIQSVYNASNKLSSLNKALLLLSKIENNQFKEVEEIRFNQLIEQILDRFTDIISLKNIHLSKRLDGKIIHKMNPVLADILISNLIQNAIRHNITNGTITIQLLEKSIIISNTGSTSVGNTTELFERFKKSETSTESIGLGLAIVKEICDNYTIEINYTCINTIHTVQLNF